MQSGRQKPWIIKQKSAGLRCIVRQKQRANARRLQHSKWCATTTAWWRWKQSRHFVGESLLAVQRCIPRNQVVRNRRHCEEFPWSWNGKQSLDHDMSSITKRDNILGERHGSLLSRSRHLPRENSRLSVALQSHQQLNLHQVALCLWWSAVRVLKSYEHVDEPANGHDLFQLGASALYHGGPTRANGLSKHERGILSKKSIEFFSSDFCLCK